MVKLNYIEVLDRASSFLEERGIEGYSILFVFLAKKGWSKTDWLLHLHQEMPLEEQKWLQDDVQMLATSYPPQYLLGYSEFYGHQLTVTEATLIPRPETEELVDRCLQENNEQALTVVDVGTGTGAIAISLKLARPSWRVSAIDISIEALNVAKQNARHLQADITFLLGDTLAPLDQKVDLILSNPPYISEDEKKDMGKNVLLYEPKVALFAKNQGLAIYQKLAEEAKRLLKPNGKIYLEIGFRQGEAVRQIYQHAFPEKIVRVKKDLAKNDRMVIVST